MRHDAITLVSDVPVRGEQGQYNRVETTRIVPCTVHSITRQEWSMAGQNGVAPVLMVKILAGNYANEVAADFNGQRYAIYRTFQETDERLALYLQKETGA